MSQKSGKGSNVLRPPRETIYMGFAKLLSTRGTCLRKSVGACLVRDGHVLGSGYNGAPRQEPECLVVGCKLVDNHCVRTVHAEVNAVLSAAYNGVTTRGAVLYTTVKPCFRCEQFLINAGVYRVVYIEEYDDGLNGKSQLLIEKYRDIVGNNA